MASGIKGINDEQGGTRGWRDGVQVQNKEKGTERKRERERGREGTHCKLNLKTGQMGAVTVARAPLFHPS